VEVTDSAPVDWDELLDSVGTEASFFQSRTQAEAIKCLDGAEALFYRVRDGGGTVVSQLLVEKRFFYDRVRGRRRFFLPFLASSDGPVLSDPDCAPDVLPLLLRAVTRRAWRTGALWVEFNGLSPFGRYCHHDKIAEIFERAGFRRGLWATLVVDLRKSEDELWRGLARAGRKAINRCRRLALEVEELVTYEAFQTRFWEPYSESERYFGRAAFDYSRQYWEIARRYVRHFAARDSSGHTIGVLGLLIYNNVAKEVSSAIAPDAFEKKIPAQDMLHWELMLAAKKSGCRFFDLAGVHPEPETSKEAGIRRFKEKWGGEYVEYFTYKRDMIPLARQAFRSLGRRFG